MSEDTFACAPSPFREAAVETEARPCAQLERAASRIREVGTSLCDLARETGDSVHAHHASKCLILAEQIRALATEAWKREAQGGEGKSDAH